MTLTHKDIYRLGELIFQFIAKFGKSATTSRQQLIRKNFWRYFRRDKFMQVKFPT